MNTEDKIKEFEEKIKELERWGHELSGKIAAASTKSESDELAELFTALAKAQRDMVPAKKDSTQPHFKNNYADFTSVVRASRDALSKNGLAMVQRICASGNGSNYLKTRLCHISGQWMESCVPIKPPRDDIQSMGSYITYLKRYSYAAMVGVVTEDDDGEGAMQDLRKEETRKKECISKAQLEVLANELEGHEDLLNEMLDKLKINKLADLPVQKYSGCLERLRQLKITKSS